MIKTFELKGYKEYYNQKIKHLVHTPFQTYQWAELHEGLFGDKFFFLVVEDGDVFCAGMALFCTATPYGNMYYSHGRFGTAGFIWNPSQTYSSGDIRHITLGFLDEIQGSIDSNAVTLSVGSLQIDKSRETEVEAFRSLCNEKSGQYFYRVNHIAPINDLVSDSKQLILSNFKRKNNLSRNLRKAKESYLFVFDTVDKKTIRRWHAIHSERVRELGGKPWELPFFINVLENPAAGPIFKFFGIYSDKELVGGAVCFFSQNVLDIFMVSTFRPWQELGANHLLSERIYLWCADNGIKYVNWQGSNPPNGGVAVFKRQWGGKESLMHSVNMVLDREKFMAVDWKNLLIDFPDRFFYPFR